MIRTARRGLMMFLGVALMVTAGTLVATAAPTASASSICPNVGSGTGCAYMITINSNGTVSIAAGANTKPIDSGFEGQGDDVIVGVLNNSNGIVHSVTLTGTGRDQLFGFDSDEICTYNFTSDAYCATNDNGGPSYTTLRNGTKEVGAGGKNPYDSEGPDNTFSGISASQDIGTVNFTTALTPQGTTYLCLEQPPTSTAKGTAVITPGLVVSAPTITGAVEGANVNDVTAFTDTGSISPATGFAATINWGDGNSSTGTVGGSAGSYTVSGSHVYQEFGTYNASVTVNDTALALNTATSATGTVNVADATLTAQNPGPTISPQETGQSFTAVVGYFTDADTYSPSSEFDGTTISWGDGTTSTVASGDVAISGSGGSFTVTGTHSYGASGTTASPVVVNIVDDGGQTATVTDNNVQVADSVQLCSGSCTGSLTSGPVTANDSTDNSGDLLLSGAANTGQLSCGDGFEHAPTVISEANTFTNVGNSTITDVETFLAADGVVNDSDPGDHGEFLVCFSSPGFSFTDITGASVTQGLLPICNPFVAAVGPCADIDISPNGSTVTETITYPAIDAAQNDPQHV